MARVSKTSPFRPRGQTNSGSNTEGEKKDEEKSSSSSDSEKDAQDKQEKVKVKGPMQAKRGNRRTTLYERINGPERAKGIITKRGSGKSVAYTLRLWSKYNLMPPKGNQDKEGNVKGKRPMQSRRGNQKTPLYEMINGQKRAKGTVTKRGRGKTRAYSLRLWSKYNLRLPRKGTDVHVSSEFEPDPNLQDDFQGSETDSEEACKRINIERHDDDDTDNDGGGAGTHRNLPSFGIEVVGK
ncbi:hypothetical protein L1987_59958 [Smallanthus sonchifolius]|uniref:Uncharacterized protein n=1 Tax=Smallanthus sonchifolius TaxID=185202 RepID=A0ACB9D7B2_9ASTR|nr:hypothetical protein L1987_59958 [Smallanthus sonchifolius]